MTLEIEKKLGTMPIKKLLISLSIPAIIGMLVNALYNLVDSIFVGIFVGPIGHSAMTVAMPLAYFIYAVAFTFAVGGAAVLSIALGKKDYEEAGRVINTTFFSTFFAGVTLMVLSLLFLPQLLALFGSGASQNVLDSAYDYAFFISIAASFVPITIFFNNFYRAEGKAFLSAIILVIGAVINIGLDPLFLGVFNMGIRGAALATITAQFVSLLVALYISFFIKHTLIKVKKFMIDFKILRRVVAVGFSSFVRNILGSILLIFVNYVISQNISDPDSVDTLIGAFVLIN